MSTSTLRKIFLVTVCTLLVPVTSASAQFFTPGTGWIGSQTKKTVHSPVSVGGGNALSLTNTFTSIGNVASAWGGIGSVTVGPPQADVGSSVKIIYTVTQSRGSGTGDFRCALADPFDKVTTALKTSSLWSGGTASASFSFPEDFIGATRAPGMYQLKCYWYIAGYGVDGPTALAQASFNLTASVGLLNAAPASLPAISKSIITVTQNPVNLWTGHTRTDLKIVRTVATTVFSTSQPVPPPPEEKDPIANMIDKTLAALIPASALGPVKTVYETTAPYRQLVGLFTSKKKLETLIEGRRQPKFVREVWKPLAQAGSFLRPFLQPLEMAAQRAIAKVPMANDLLKGLQNPAVAKPVGLFATAFSVLGLYVGLRSIGKNSKDLEERLRTSGISALGTGAGLASAQRTGSNVLSITAGVLGLGSVGAAALSGGTATPLALFMGAAAVHAGTGALALDVGASVADGSAGQAAGSVVATGVAVSKKATAEMRAWAEAKIAEIKEWQDAATTKLRNWFYETNRVVTMWGDTADTRVRAWLEGAKNNATALLSGLGLGWALAWATDQVLARIADSARGHIGYLVTWGHNTVNDIRSWVEGQTSAIANRAQQADARLRAWMTSDNAIDEWGSIQNEAAQARNDLESVASGVRTTMDDRGRFINHEYANAWANIQTEFDQGVDKINQWVQTQNKTAVQLLEKKVIEPVSTQIIAPVTEWATKNVVAPIVEAVEPLGKFVSDVGRGIEDGARTFAGWIGWKI